MKLLNRWERKFGRVAIRGLMGYIVGVNALVFFINIMEPELNVESILMFHPALVLQGEYWRLITFIFIPPTAMPIFAIFVFLFYYLVGTRLEQEWGSFRFNVYYFTGMLATLAASFVFWQPGFPHYLNLSLFLAFATLYPDYQIRLFLMLPLKVKYLAWAYVAILALTFLSAPLSSYSVMAVASLANYFLFFGGHLLRRAKMKKTAYQGRARFQSKLPSRQTIHRCHLCGRTEEDDPDLEFRYCSKCRGHYEYCMEHLRDHQHVE